MSLQTPMLTLTGIFQTPHKESRMSRADPYADIDFDEVTEATGLAMDEIKCLKVSKLGIH